MSKKQFLKRLNKKLKVLPSAERKKALDYYAELIDDRVEAGFTEEAAVMELGEVNDAANGMIADAEERGVKLRRSGGRWIVALLFGILCGVLLYFLATFLYSHIDDTIVPWLDRAGGEWVERTAEYEVSEIDGLIVELRDYDLFIGASDDGKAHFTYYENDVTEFELSRSDTSIELKQKNQKRHWLYFWKKPRQAVIMLPESFGDIVVSSSTGEVRVDNYNTASSIGIDGATSDIIVYDVSAVEFAASLPTGDVHLGRCTFADGLTVKGGTSDVYVDNVECGELFVSCTTGEVKLTEITADTVTAKTTTGNISTHQITADSVNAKASTGEIVLHTIKANSVEAESTTGDIRLYSFDSMDTKLTVSTGDVIGEQLAGSIADYSIETSTSTGKNNLPSVLTMGERKLYVKTTTGNINVKFELGGNE